MKTKRIFSILSMMVMGVVLTSCFSDLDPKDLGSKSSLSNAVYATKDDYLAGLAKLYASFTVSGQIGPAGSGDIAGLDEGFGEYLRGYFNCQELSTDEAVLAWNDQTVKNFHWQNWAPNDVFITGMYSRCIYTATLANEFIRVTAGSDDADIKRYHAEARFVRALAYWHALDLFGNPPFVTESDLPGGFYPAQTTAQKLFDYLDKEVTEIEADLGDPGFEYGRADKAALWMLQAKLYLNSEVYTNHAAKRYADVITAMGKLISSNKYTLATEYRQNFVGDNNLSPEIIFAINFDGAHTQSYGGMNYIIHAAIGGAMSANAYGVAGGWTGTRTTKALVNKFADPTGATDKRAMFFTNGQKLEIDDIGTFTDGYAVSKFTNLYFNGSSSPLGFTDYVDTDYPMFRLADAYLMRAEAILRNGGTAADALPDVNKVLDRAYGNTSGEITAAQLTLPWILDERARELYWEGHRRTDLIRFGQFTDGDYVWPWKGNTKDGQAVASFRNLYPIPTQDLSSNPTLIQNEGYQ